MTERLDVGRPPFCGLVASEQDEAEQLVVIIPCKNEARGIGSTVREVLGVADELPMEVRIVMIDDGSSDGTQSEMELLCRDDGRCQMVVNPRSFGVGRCVLNVVEELPGRTWVTGIPGDQEFQFNSIWNHLQVRHKYDLILGYYGNPVIRTFGRRLASQVFVRITNIMYGFTFRYLNGMKLFRVDCFKGLNILSSGHAFNGELMAKALLRHPEIRIGEVPFIARGRARGVSKAMRPLAVVKAISETYQGRRAVSEYRRQVIEAGD